VLRGMVKSVLAVGTTTACSSSPSPSPSRRLPTVYLHIQDKTNVGVSILLGRVAHLNISTPVMTVVSTD
jgi:hypothetical protein